MDRKIKSTIALAVLLVLICSIGVVYTMIIQKNKIKKDTVKLNTLAAQCQDQAQLEIKLAQTKIEVLKIDSALATYKYNVPKDIGQIAFYTFVNSRTTGLSPLSKVNAEYTESKQEKEFTYYEYKLTGVADFNELYRLIYSLEESRELKKVKSIVLSNQVVTDDDKVPNFMVNYTLVVDAYFANSNKYITQEKMENNLGTSTLYDAFFPLVRNEIPPNLDELLEVQGARLLALLPDGAFLSDARGKTYMLTEGDPVYLGYLTKIDMQNNKVHFILNKGGIIEKVNIQLEPEQKPGNK